MSQNDGLPSHICSKCMTRVVSLEKASTDLAAFKRSAMSIFERAHKSLKRTKKTTESLLRGGDLESQEARVEIQNPPANHEPSPPSVDTGS